MPGNDRTVNEILDARSLLEHAWKYFEVHANQRIKLFQFYLGFLTLYLTASGFLFLRFSCTGILAEISTIVLSIIVTLLTVMFQLLDARNRQLVDYAKDAIKLIEAKYFPVNNDDLNTKIFTRENTDKAKRNNKILHSTCFRSLFRGAYIISLIIFIISIILLCYYRNSGDKC